jgi:alanine racemase
VNGLIRAVIDRSALRENLRRIRLAAPGSRVMAVVKANAYGHGLVPVAQALDDSDGFAVARIEEAIALREAGVRGTILLLEGVFDAEQLEAAARHALDVVVHESLQLALLRAAPSDCRFVVWLKIDTGMNRLGFRPEAFEAALAQLHSLGPQVAGIHVLTHFARADDPADPMTRDQTARFLRLAAGRGLPLSLANSAALLSLPESRADWVRPGLALYGVSPFPGRTAASLGLVPVMNLETRVIAQRTVPRGETVGYGGSWRAPRDSRIAIIAAGYGDGLPWNLQSGTPFLVGGHRLPLVGRVSMDMIAVDATDAPPFDIGSTVLLWGRGLPVEDVAAAARTIPYELLCAVSQRVPLVLRE